MASPSIETIDLEVPVIIPLRVNDASAALDKLMDASANVPGRLKQLRALRGLDEETKQKWLLAHMLPGEPHPDRNVQAGCALVIVTVLVIVGYNLVQWYNAHTQQTEEREEPIYEQREVEKEVCPDKK